MEEGSRQQWVTLDEAIARCEQGQIEDAKTELVRRTGFKNCYVRAIAWRGSEMMGVSAQNNTIHVAIAAWEWPSYFSPELLEKGIRLKWAKFRRPAPIIAGILVATLVNHGLAGAVGEAVARLMGPQLLRWVIGGSFIAMAVWMLTQMKRWGQIKGDVDFKAVAEQVYLATDTAKVMTEMGLTAPAKSYKSFSVMGKTFDPDKPDDYLAGFKIKKSS